MKKTFKFLLTATLAASVAFSGCNKNPQDNKENFDLSKKNEFVRTEYSKQTVADGIYNNFQIGGYYDPTRVIPADSVMAYASTISGVETLIKSYLGKGFKQVDMMIPNGRDMGCFFIHGGYDGKMHEDIVQKSRDGAWKLHTAKRGGRCCICKQRQYTIFFAACKPPEANSITQKVLIIDRDFCALCIILIFISDQKGKLPVDKR